MISDEFQVEGQNRRSRLVDLEFCTAWKVPHLPEKWSWYAQRVYNSHPNSGKEKQKSLPFCWNDWRMPLGSVRGCCEITAIVGHMQFCPDFFVHWLGLFGSCSQMRNGPRTERQRPVQTESECLVIHSLLPAWSNARCRFRFAPVILAVRWMRDGNGWAQLEDMIRKKKFQLGLFLNKRPSRR